ncbi:LCP family protein [Streptomyces sp. NPDC090025]|uniref:LCP family protein n=1 Tax=Streptomyces sp. NPDC090025 TaxID=3365922 RepID=UPI0038360C91
MRSAPVRGRRRKAGARRTAASARRAGGSRALARRRLRRRAWITLAVVLGVPALLAGAVAGWLFVRFEGAIETFGADGVAGDRPSPGPAKGQNILLIGSDARTGGNSGLGGGAEDDVGRSDTTLLLHINADRRHATAVSIPRDTLVTIPACKLPDGTWTRPRADAMFNAAYAVGEQPRGNPACTQNTVERLTGLRVDHTVVVDFKGFAKLTEAVGGVPVCVPRDVYQRDLDPSRTTRGELVLAKGRQEVAGQRALDYVRIRHGIGDGSDIGRIKRQQAFVAALIRKLKTDGLTPTRLLPLAEAATESLAVDPGLGSADKLISFAGSLRDIELRDTTFVTLPWRYAGNRVAIVQPDADALWSALKNDRPLKPSPSPSRADPSPDTTRTVIGAGTRVAVLNGTTTPGLAARASRLLADHGFTVTRTANAPRRPRTTTVITHPPGLAAQAHTVAQLLPGARLEEAGGPEITVILGQDHRAPRPPAATPPSLPDGARTAADDACADLSYG